MSDEAVAPALFPERIETNSLRLHGMGTDLVSLDDVRHLFDSLETPDEVFEYTSWTAPETPRELIDYFESHRDLREKGERAEYLVYEREADSDTAAPIGVGYIRFDDDLVRGVPGVWFRRPYWGEGYGGEMLDQFLQIGFEDVGVEVVRVDCLAGNVQSLRCISKCMERHGGQYGGTVMMYKPEFNVEEAVPQHRLSITKSQYRDEDATFTSNVPGVDLEDIDLRLGTR